MRWVPHRSVPEDADLFVVSIARAAAATIAERASDARAALAPIAFDALQGAWGFGGLSQSATRSSRARSPLPPGPRRTGRAPRVEATLAEQASVFRRDGYTCRYCGRRTILLQVLRLISDLYPTEVPFHPNWKRSAAHPAYWTHVATVDHIVPLARAGTNEPSNLAAACYACQTTKSDWLLSERGWTLRPSAGYGWDGLESYLVPLSRMSPSGSTRLYRSWQRVLASPYREGRGVSAPPVAE